MNLNEISLCQCLNKNIRNKMVQDMISARRFLKYHIKEETFMIVSSSLNSIIYSSFII